jgi:hypothetical protein
MLAGGIHFQDEWWIWKKNNNYLHPNSSIQFNNSWDVTTIGDGLLGWGDSSPWISARKFCDFWSARVDYQDFSAEDILAAPAVVYDQPYYQGDVISVINSSGEAEHTMYISGYGIYNSEATYLLTYHSVNRESISLLEVVADFAKQGDYEYRFYKMN